MARGKAISQDEGAAIRLFRQQHGWSYGRIAKHLGTGRSRQAIQQHEILMRQRGDWDQLTLDIGEAE